MRSCQVHVSSGGYVGLPVDICKDLHIQEGDILQLVVVNGEIHLQTRQHNIRKAQALLRNYIPANICLSEDFMKERKVEARNE